MPGQVVKVRPGRISQYFNTRTHAAPGTGFTRPIKKLQKVYLTYSDINQVGRLSTLHRHWSDNLPGAVSQQLMSNSKRTGTGMPGTNSHLTSLESLELVQC